MIAGIGQDIIEVERVKKACEKVSFLEHCFTEAEREKFCGKAQSLAGNFAAKEAVAKAFGTGFVPFGLLDVEVLRDVSGAPFVNLYGNAAKLAEEMGITKIFVTISNLKELATAVVVLEKQE